MTKDTANITRDRRCFKAEVHHVIGFKVKDEVEQAFRIGFNEGKRIYESKHWNECGQIAEYDNDLKKVMSLLKKICSAKNYTELNHAVQEAENFLKEGEK